jgi:diguanylate cyclase (GGDEF)-like protein/PAS domain S-box-containing protein
MRDKFGRYATACGLFAVGLALIALVGWIGGNLLLASFNNKYPMAPSTAVIILVFGIILTRLSRRDLSNAGRTVGAIVVIICMALTIIFLRNLLLEIAKLGQVPIGRMPPLTAGAFLLTAVSFLALLQVAPGRRAGAVLGAIVTFIGAAAILGYLDGAPLLYGGKMIPMSVPTALGFIALGSGLIAHAGPEVWPLASLVGPSVRARILRVFLPLLVIVVIAVGLFRTHVVPGRFDPLLISADVIVTVIVAVFAASFLAKSVGAAVKATETLLDKTVASFQEAVFVIDPADCTVKACNPAGERIFGYSDTEMLGHTMETLFLDFDSFDEFRRLVFSAIKSQGALGNMEWDMKRKDGTIFPSEHTVSEIQETSLNGRALVCVVRDITERKEREQQISYINYHDLLTGLPNRAGFKERMSVALAVADLEQKVLAVCHLNLDGFKQINEAYGWEFGDKLIMDCARRLAEAIGGDELLARIGVDEFGIGLQGVSDINEVAKRSRELLRAISGPPFVIDRRELHITAGAGVSLFPNDGSEIEELLTNAEVAMRQAKRLGRNSFDFYNAELHKKLSERLALENSFVRALKQGEFTVYYQPLIDMHSGRIIGVEALARWRHPERGLLDPDLFIALAEETGLITSLGEIIMREACLQVEKWQRVVQPGLRLTVNISAVQLRQSDIVSVVNQVLGETGLSPDDLELELTETTFMEETEAAVRTMSVLKAQGVQIAIDDFGTGYSSLAVLKGLPIDTLKIDRTFIKDMTISDDAKAIVRTIISMARILKLGVVAEGVETRQHFELLRSLNGDVVQGFLFSPPVSADDMGELLRDGREFLGQAA